MSAPMLRLAGPVLDAAHPLERVRFYERLLGWPIVRSEGPRPGRPPVDGWALSRSPDGSQKIEIRWEPSYFAPTWAPVAGEHLMMIPLDFGVDDLEAGAVWAPDDGARLADHQPQEHVRVMLDPESHPLRLFLDER